MKIKHTIESKWQTLGCSLLAAMLIAALCVSDSTKAESSIVGAVSNVGGDPTIEKVNGEIIPIVWRAKIGAAVASIPLSAIEHYGIQDYNIDGVSLIRELTITTKSLSMVRIYHILPLGAIHKDAAHRLDNKLKDVEGVVRGLRSQDDDLPIKSYPTTTHEKMVEYRVSEVNDIAVLYESLDKAMITYLGRDLMPSQRPMIVQTVTIGKNGAPKATEESEQAVPPNGP
jgi:hypothetical protein